MIPKDEELKELVRDACPNSLIVSEPDVLVTILNNLSRRRYEFVS